MPGVSADLSRDGKHVAFNFHGGAGSDHGNDDPDDLSQLGPASGRRQAVPRREDGSGERKWQCEDGVLELDHFEHGAQAASHIR